MVAFSILIYGKRSLEGRRTGWPVEEPVPGQRGAEAASLACVQCHWRHLHVSVCNGWWSWAGGGGVSEKTRRIRLIGTWKGQLAGQLLAWRHIQESSPEAQDESEEAWTPQCKVSSGLCQEQMYIRLPRRPPGQRPRNKVSQRWMQEVICRGFCESEARAGVGFLCRLHCISW